MNAVLFQAPLLEKTILSTYAFFSAEPKGFSVTVANDQKYRIDLIRCIVTPDFSFSPGGQYGRCFSRNSQTFCGFSSIHSIGTVPFVTASPP